MKRRCLPGLLALCVSGAALSTPAGAQTPDTAARPAAAVAVIHEPTVFVLSSESDTSRLAAAVGAARAVAESLGFAVTARTTRLEQVIDPANAGVYYVPRSLTAGYLITAPGRRPDAVFHLFDTDSLRAHLRAYVQLQRHLRPAPD